jgi:pimeloyl-ACP methyl ester carboxylesterase
MPHLKLRDGAELYYEKHGSGPPLFLVPGLGGDGRFWDANARELAQQFTVVVHDHRGTARSTLSKIKYSVEQMANDALQLIDELGYARVHWCGHSTGGAMGQVLAISQPDRIDRLVLSAITTRISPPPRPARTRPFRSPRSCCRASPPSWRMTGANSCRKSARRLSPSSPAMTW